MVKALQFLFALLWKLPIIIGQSYLLAKLFQLINIVFKLGVDTSKSDVYIGLAVFIFNYVLLRAGKRLCLIYQQGKISIGIEAIEASDE